MDKDKSRAVKFTVIIPTRDRCDTLKWTLKTCTTQDYDNFEIIVSDNFSQDETRQVVEDAKDSRIRYLNTGKRVSMTTNFEFGLSHATGDYVCFIGDDDGLMPNALQELGQLLSDFEIEAVTWHKAVYLWNSWYEEERKNTLQVRIEKKLRKYDAHETLEELLDFSSARRLTYTDLASLYHGFVRTDIINGLRATSGRFFNSMNPDIYAAVALTSVLKSFWHTAVPYTIPGASHHSTGLHSGNPVSAEKFWAEVDIACHPSIKRVPTSAPIGTVESLLKAQELIPAARQFTFNVEGLLTRAMEDGISLSPEQYRLLVDTVKHISEVYGVKNPAAEEITRTQDAGVPGMLFGYNPFNDFLVLRFDERQVQNIYDATVIFKRILDQRSVTFYAREVIRFLSSSIRTYGIRSSVDKLWRRTFSTSRVAQS